MDDSQTCAICREIYKAPVTATCGHRFATTASWNTAGRSGTASSSSFFFFFEDDEEKEEARRREEEEEDEENENENEEEDAMGEDDDDDDDDEEITTTSPRPKREGKEKEEEDEMTTTATATKGFGKVVDFRNPAPCPICNASITSLTPNVALTKVIDALARVDAMTMQITDEHSPLEPQHSKIARAEKVVSALQHMDEEQLAPIVKALSEKHARAVAEGEEKRLEILRVFFDEAMSRKRMKMAEAETEMKFLRMDIKKVEKLLREELKVLKMSYEETEGGGGGGRGGRGERGEEDEDVADMLRFVPQLPGSEQGAHGEEEKLERKYHAGLCSLYTKGIKEIDGINSSVGEGGEKEEKIFEEEGGQGGRGAR